MSAFKELAAIAAKVAADKVVKTNSVIKDTLAAMTGATVGEVVEKAAQKIDLDLYRTNRWGEKVLKIPFFKTTDDKILEAFDKHPERKKVCFHFECTYASIKQGVIFYDPDGNQVYSIPASNKNLKGIELYQGDRFIGRITKHITLNLNPLSDLQKYDFLINTRTGIIRVNMFNASMDNASWTMNHKASKDYIIENKDGEEIARFYSLGFANFVFDYDGSVDPAELLLTFMAVQVRSQETTNNHRGDRKKILGSFTGDIKDIF